MQTSKIVCPYCGSACRNGVLRRVRIERILRERPLSDIEYESVTQADRLAESIADSVLSGEFGPGFRLDENALADRFGVSRTPVREAIRLLASTGLIEVKP